MKSRIWKRSAGLKLAFDAAAAGGSMPTVYNAANERAVAKFLDRKIAYLQIPEIIETCMGHHTGKRESVCGRDSGYRAGGIRIYRKQVVS